MLVEEGIEARNVNGILGLLCREHFPGLVWMSEYEDPEVPSFDHYALVGKGPLTLGKGIAEGGPRQRALGEF